jgi:hypothetical protein
MNRINRMPDEKARILPILFILLILSIHPGRGFSLRLCVLCPSRFAFGSESVEQKETDSD